MGINPLQEFGRTVESLKLKAYGEPLTDVRDHGTLVAAFAGGQTLGVARKAELIHVQTPEELNIKWPLERFLEALIVVANKCVGRPKDTTVVNMSTGIRLDMADPYVWHIMSKKPSRFTIAKVMRTNESLADTETLMM